MGGIPFYEDPSLGQWQLAHPHATALALPFAQLLSALVELFGVPLAYDYLLLCMLLYAYCTCAVPQVNMCVSTKVC